MEDVDRRIWLGKIGIPERTVYSRLENPPANNIPLGGLENIRGMCWEEKHQNHPGQW